MYVEKGILNALNKLKLHQVFNLFHLYLNYMLSISFTFQTEGILSTLGLFEMGEQNNSNTNGEFP